MGLPFRPMVFRMPDDFGGPAPDFDATRRRLRRPLLSPMDPDALAQQQEAEALQQIITRNLQPAPVREVPRGQMLVDAVIAGLGNQEPDAGGVGGFVSDVARSAGAVRGVAQRIEAQTVGRQQAAASQREDALLAAIEAAGKVRLQRAQAVAALREKPTGTTQPAAAVQEAEMLARMSPEEYKAYQQRKLGLQPQPAPAQPTFVFAPGVDANGNPVMVNPRNPTQKVSVAGVTRPDPAPQRDPVQVVNQRVQYQGTLAKIAEAEAAVTAYPNAVGLDKAAMNAIGYADRKDPQGTAARAAIADLASSIILLRSGAAVTASEFPRLRPFIPLISDKPETVRAKLTRYREIVQEEANLYEAALKQSGYGTGAAPAGASTAPAETPEQRAARLRGMVQ